MHTRKLASPWGRIRGFVGTGINTKQASMNDQTVQETTLYKDVRTVIRSGDIHRVKTDKDTRRVVVHLISDFPDKDRTIKRYYVCITPEYAKRNFNVELDNTSAANIALQITKRRLEENKKLVPIEDGVSLVDSGLIIVDPSIYIHPDEKQQ